MYVVTVPEKFLAFLERKRTFNQTYKIIKYFLLKVMICSRKIFEKFPGLVIISILLAHRSYLYKRIVNSFNFALKTVGQVIGFKGTLTQTRSCSAEVSGVIICDRHTALAYAESIKWTKDVKIIVLNLMNKFLECS